MATSYPVPLSVRSAALSSSTAPAAPHDLAGLKIGVPAQVIGLGVDDAGAAWLRAVGIEEREVVVVLRRAPFGGPLHVRTASGGEFALNRELARNIRLSLDVQPDPLEPA